MLSDLKKFKAQTTLVLKYTKRNKRKIFYSSSKLIARDLDIDEAFKAMHESIMKKLGVFFELIVKHSLQIFESYFKLK